MHRPLDDSRSRFKIVLTEDGCWRKDLTTEIPAMPAMRRTMREWLRRGTGSTTSRWSTSRPGAI
jgi:hypothetical protein